MAWDDTYNDRAALRGTITSFTTSPDGAPAAWIHNGENAEQSTSNRPADALAANCDLMRDALGDETAPATFKGLTQVANLSTFSGSTITIDPTGVGPADIVYASAGYLYVGNSNYSGATPEHYKTLFQVLDSDNNEVMVDGNEVIVSGIAPTSLGSGFYNSGIVTLSLNETLPSGNYRLAYAKETTLGDLPDDALIAADIRGLHEAVSESGFKSAYVLDANSTGPCDFSGATALQDALAAAGQRCTLFLRPGTYNLAEVGGGELNINQNEVHIIGSGRDTANGTKLVVDSGSAHDLTLAGDNILLENLCIVAAAPGQNVNIASAQNACLRNCYLEYLGVIVTSSFEGRMERVEIASDDQTLLSIATGRWKFDQCYFGSGGSTGTDPIVFIDGADYLSFTSCRLLQGATAGLQPALEIAHGDMLSFDDCLISSKLAPAFVYGEATITSKIQASFSSCEFKNEPSNTVGSSFGPIMPKTVNIRQAARMTFNNCYVYTDNTATEYYQGPFVQLLARSAIDAADDLNTDLEGKITLNNVKFRDVACKGVLATDNPSPPTTITGSGYRATMWFFGVSGTSVVYDRDAVEYDLQEAPWIDMDGASINELQLVYGVNQQPYQMDTGITPQPMIICNEGSTVVDLSVVGFMGKGSTATSGDWKRPLLDVRGTLSSSPSPTAAEPGYSKVDGLAIRQLDDPGGSEPYEWEFSHDAMVYVTNGTLERFNWATLNKLCYTGATLTCLVRLDASGRLSRSSIQHADGTGGASYGGLLQSVVRLYGNKAAVDDNSIWVEDPNLATVGMVNLIYASSVDGCQIEGNDIETPVSIPSGTGAMVQFVGLSYGNRIANNRMKGTHASGTPNFIDFSSDFNIVVGNE